MSQKENTCPVCFTKMRTQSNVLVCPECGYKLCDHSYTYHDSYSTEHTHTPEYTTSYKTSSEQQPINTFMTDSQINSGYQKKVKLTGTRKIILLLVIIYIVIPVLSSLFSLFSYFMKAFFRL